MEKILPYSVDILSSKINDFRDDNRFLIFSPIPHIVKFIPYDLLPKNIKKHNTIADWNLKYIEYTYDNILKLLDCARLYLMTEISDSRGWNLAKLSIEIQSYCWLLGHDIFGKYKHVELITYVSNNFFAGK